MTEVRVYEGVGSVERFAERLLRERLFPAGQRTLVMLSNARSASDFDRLLWTAKPESFIPHVLAEHRLAAETPVVIAAADGGSPEVANFDVLVNCSGRQLLDFASFPQLVDLVAGAAETDAGAQERIDEYRQRGHQLKVFSMRARS